MKKILNFSFLILFILLTCSACQKKNSNTRKSTKNDVQIYPVKVTDIHGHRGEIVISGTTKAPDNSQIVVQQTNDSNYNFFNQAHSSHVGNAKAVYVKNNEFKAIVFSSALSSLNNGSLKKGDVFSLKIMAIDNYPKKIGVVTNKKIGTAIKTANIKPYKFKLTKDMHF